MSGCGGRKAAAGGIRVEDVQRVIAHAGTSSRERFGQREVQRRPPRMVGITGSPLPPVPVDGQVRETAVAWLPSGPASACVTLGAPLSLGFSCTAWSGHSLCPQVTVKPYVSSVKGSKCQPSLHCPAVSLVLSFLSPLGKCHLEFLFPWPNRMPHVSLSPPVCAFSLT